MYLGSFSRIESSIMTTEQAQLELTLGYLIGSQTWRPALMIKPAIPDISLSIWVMFLL